jgi:hypothetical protein
MSQGKNQREKGQEMKLQELTESSKIQIHKEDDMVAIRGEAADQLASLLNIKPGYKESFWKKTSYLYDAKTHELYIGKNLKNMVGSVLDHPEDYK